MHERTDSSAGRAGLRFSFAALAVAAFAAMLAFAATSPQAMARPLVGPVPASLVIAAAMIGFAVVLTGIYVLIADRETR